MDRFVKYDEYNQGRLNNQAEIDGIIPILIQRQ